MALTNSEGVAKMEYLSCFKVDDTIGPLEFFFSHFRWKYFWNDPDPFNGPIWPIYGPFATRSQKS